MITKEQAQTAAQGLDQRDFETFANRIAAIDPVVGIVEQYHAEAADGNSPDLDYWVKSTVEDAATLQTKGITTRRQAAQWWYEQFCNAPDGYSFEDFLADSETKL